MAKTLEIANEAMSSARTTVGCEDFLSSSAKFGLSILMVVPVIAGIWSTLCVVSATMNCDNIKAVGRCLITALTGM